MSTWCLDMGDNLNANGAAPVAPYVFLSFLFKIVVEFMFLLCILHYKKRHIRDILGRTNFFLSYL